VLDILLTGFTATLESSKLISVFCLESTGQHLRAFPVLLVDGDLVLLLLDALIALMKHGCCVVH
jgi:hypothetical protein